MCADLIRRHVYGRRQGHKLHPRQADLVTQILPNLRVPQGPFDPLAQFGFQPDTISLEIGFGGGEHLARQAAQAPGEGFIGCEPFLNGVAKLLMAIDAQSLNNIRIHDDDARDLMEWLPDGCLDRIFLLYPDPWPKTRHHKRRFISPENLHQFFRILKPGGKLMVASDIPNYIMWSLAHIRDHGGFIWQADVADDWRRPPQGWEPTRYEAKAVRAGRIPTYLHFKRRDVQMRAIL